MKASKLIRIVDQVSYWSGKTFAWLIVALTLVVSVEVFKRYILNAPTAWIFDFNNMIYGTLFMMCGGYTLAPGGHVRADFVYTYLRPRVQAALDLSLYFLFVIPIAGALVMLQGIAEIVRCIVCLRTGAWPSRLSDVEEIDVIDTQLSKSEYVDEESRRVATESAKSI